MEIPKKIIGHAYEWHGPVGRKFMGRFLGYGESGTLNWDNGETTTDDIRFKPVETETQKKGLFPWGKR